MPRTPARADSDACVALARARGSGERLSFAWRFGAGFGAVAAALLGLPAAAVLLPEATIRVRAFK